MAAAVAQLGLNQSDSQLLSSTHCGAYCSNGELCSDASSGNSSKPLLKPNWQSLYVKRSGITGSSSQTQAAVSCFAMQHQYQPLQSRSTVEDARDAHQRLSPTTPGGLAVPPARYLKLSCEPLVGTSAGMPTPAQWTPSPAPALAGDVAGCPAEQACSGSDSRRQLQQWLARREASVMAKSVAGAAAGSSSNSSSGTAAVEDKQLRDPAFELAQALPPPAFLILGVLG